MDEVRGGRDGGLLLLAVPGLVVCWTADTVVTLDVTDDASLPEDPAPPNSSSNDGREDLEGRSGEACERSVFIASGGWREGENRVNRGRERGERERLNERRYLDEGKESPMIRVYAVVVEVVIVVVVIVVVVIVVVVVMVVVVWRVSRRMAESSSRKPSAIYGVCPSRRSIFFGLSASHHHHQHHHYHHDYTQLYTTIHKQHTHKESPR